MDGDIQLISELASEMASTSKLLATVLRYLWNIFLSMIFFIICTGGSNFLLGNCPDDWLNRWAAKALSTGGRLGYNAFMPFPKLSSCCLTRGRVQNSTQAGGCWTLIKYVASSQWEGRAKTDVRSTHFKTFVVTGGVGQQNTQTQQKWLDERWVLFRQA